MVIPASPTAIPTVTDGVRQLLRTRNGRDEEIAKVELALQEALANAVRHGCKGDSTKQIQCVLTFGAAGDIVIVVRDPGPGFDPVAMPDPLAGDNLFKAERPRRLLINRLMDEVGFRDGGRELQMKKSASSANGLPSA